MKNSTICKVSESDALAFLRKNKAHHESVSVTSSEEWLGAFVDGELCGVVGRIKLGSKNRIKSFFVAKSHRGEGIGFRLLREIITEGKCSAFATKSSRQLFIRHGFIPTSDNKAITFLTKE